MICLLGVSLLFKFMSSLYILERNLLAEMLLFCRMFLPSSNCFSSEAFNEKLPCLLLLYPFPDLQCFSDTHYLCLYHEVFSSSIPHFSVIYIFLYFTLNFVNGERKESVSFFYMWTSSFSCTTAEELISLMCVFLNFVSKHCQWNCA